MRLAECELEAAAILTRAGVDSPGLCARLLCAHAAGLSRIDYILARDQEQKNGPCFRELVKRRAAGEPLAYILGKKEFYGHDFRVSPAVLIPRPETEGIVDLALKRVREQNIFFVDMGCGCGCIGESLLLHRPAWRGILLDASLAALAIAKENATALGCSPVFLGADVFALPLAAASVDLVVANPPYIAGEERPRVMAETLAYEPHSALFSPERGLSHLAAVIKGAGNCLKNGGAIILEHGAGQKNAVTRMLAEEGFCEIADYRDLAGLSRCAFARKRRD